MNIQKRKFHINHWRGFDKQLLINAIDAVDQLKDIGYGTRVFIKPNFTFPFFKPGVTTPPDLIRGIVGVLIERGAQVTIGEGGASLDVFDVQDSFADHGLYELEKQYGIRLSHLRDEKVVFLNFGRKRSARNVPIPRILIENTDLFITLPVPKVHATTTVSLAAKNQWGCIAARKRFLFHPSFNEIIVGLHKLLPKQLVVCDGRHVLTENGPMFGTAKQCSFLSVSNDVGTFDVAMCRLMGFAPTKISHIRFMIKHGLAPKSLEEIEWNSDPLEFKSFDFQLRRTLQNYIALAGFHNSLITWLGYDSFASKFLHKILYALKPNPLEKEMTERHAAGGAR